MRLGLAILVLTASLVGSASAAELNVRADSFVLEAGKVELGIWPYTRMIATIAASARLTNRSGVAVGISVKGESASIGGCSGQERTGGLDVVWPDDLQRLRREAESGLDVSSSLTYLPADGSVNFTVALNCGGDADQFPRTVSIGLSLVIATQTQVLVIPVSASDVPVAP